MHSEKGKDCDRNEGLDVGRNEGWDGCSSSCALLLGDALWFSSFSGHEEFCDSSNVKGGETYSGSEGHSLTLLPSSLFTSFPLTSFFILHALL